MLAILLLSVAPSVRAILGRPVPEWPPKAAERWVQGGPLTLAELRGKVVLLRFFMESECPYCRETAPALNELHRELGARGLVVIGMYTPKPEPRPVTTAKVREYVRAFGFEFPVAVDDDWGALETLWLARVKDAKFTSATLLIDRHGILRHVHEGGAYAKDSPDRKSRKDFAELRQAVLEALAEP